MPANRTYNNQQEELAALHSALRAVIADGRRADQTIGVILREHRSWSGNHKKDWAEAVYGIIANWRRLWFLSGSEPKDNWNIATSRQLRELWLLLRTGNAAGHPDPREAKNLQKRIQQSARTVALRDSWPDWLDALCSEAYGKEWSGLSHELHQPPPVFLRCNTLKTDVPALLARMHEEGLQATAVDSAGVALTSTHAPSQLIHSQCYRAGLFEVQDLHSQSVSPLLRAVPGETVVDFCAGEGGKTLHLAALMQNKGRLLAGDSADWKLDRLKLRARRAGISNLQIIPPTEGKRWKRLTGQCDAVLVDAPCSGLGSLRRHVDIKWHLTAQQLHNLHSEQQQLLQQALRLLKPGGRLVYVTCSILPSEGEHQISALLSSQPKLKLDTQVRLQPAPLKGDGFYAAVCTA